GWRAVAPITPRISADVGKTVGVYHPHTSCSEVPNFPMIDWAARRMNDSAAPTNQTTVKLLRAFSSGVRSGFVFFAILIPPADFYRDRRVFESLYLDFGEAAHQHWKTF